MNNLKKDHSIPFTANECEDKGLLNGITEKDFTETCADFLEEQKHKIISKHTNLRNQLNTDIVSEKDNTIYYTEVKRDAGHHRIQTAIGQLVYYKMMLKDDGDKHKYQIAVPKKYEKNRHFSNGVKEHLRDKLRIELIFVSC